jgi:hypothetical protein
MYKLKEGMNLPKQFKIKVNPEQSKALQIQLHKSEFEYDKDSGYVHIDFGYIFIENQKITFGLLKDYFNENRLQGIRFKDYFQKVTESFPENWCIEVTEGNLKELNVWMHRNWKNYPKYTDKWEVEIRSGIFYSSSHDGYDLGHRNVFYELITTEQFRKQFGILTETKQEIEAIESNLEFWKNRANYHKQRCKDLRLERYKLSKELEIYKSVIRKIESNLKNMFIPF